MTAKTSHITLILVFLTWFGRVGATSPEIMTFYATVKAEGQTLESFLEQDVGVPKDLLFQQGWLGRIRSWNPSLDPSQPMVTGQKIYVELPYGTILNPKKTTPVFSAQVIEPIITAKQKPKDPSPISRKWELSAFYSLSMGSFSQTSNNGADFVNSDQNTPIQLGLITKYHLNSFDQLLAMFSFSKLNRAEVKNTNENLELPWEYNLDVFYQRAFSQGVFLPYVGLSLDKISNYNVSDFSVSSAPVILESVQTYFTIGTQYKFNIMTQRLLADVQFSNVLSSSNSQSLLTSDESFSGQRIQLKLEFLNDSRLSYFVSYSLHRFSGPAELSINRFGGGLSYSFL